MSSDYSQTARLRCPRHSLFLSVKSRHDLDGRNCPRMYLMCWVFLRRGHDLKITSGSRIMYLRLTRGTAREEVGAKSPREADIELHAVQEIRYLRAPTRAASRYPSATRTSIRITAERSRFWRTSKNRPGGGWRQPKPEKALTLHAETTARILSAFVNQAFDRLNEQSAANSLVLRGF